MVAESASFGCESFGAVRLLRLSPRKTVHLNQGRHVLALIRGNVVVKGVSEKLQMSSLDQVVVVNDEPVTIQSTTASDGKVVILTAADEQAAFSADDTTGDANFTEVHIDDDGQDSVDIDWVTASPFPVKRVYFTHSVGLGAERGGHAHRSLRQVLVAAHGVIDLRLRSGEGELSVQLGDINHGVLVRPVTWRDITMYEESHLMVLASDLYDESDYIRDFSVFLVEAGERPEPHNSR